MKPKVRCYDSGPDGSIDRYTVVYPDNSYVGMSGAPFHPQGFCQYGESETPIDRPTWRHLGRKIKFNSLPEDCQKVVLRDLA